MSDDPAYIAARELDAELQRLRKVEAEAKTTKSASAALSWPDAFVIALMLIALSLLIGSVADYHR